MVPLSNTMILMCLIGSSITVLAMLRVFANVIEHETDLHDLRNRVKALQYQKQLYLARIQGHIAEEEGEIEILDDDPIEAVEQASQAALEVGEAIDAQSQATQAA
ncbi:MAG: hypothetical protein CMJ35_02580 [Phycisphaerae bacterium]|nr:hypothetical protein [Phycisphaerae bacterium]MBM90484.1 hypothetical protein [Phycisphaerae bacterium]HCT45860.1 hypothetical protein [Phycisphaerales bacterium]|tara:strand:+ start:189 stop:503 length:315 start_codon:yes stop_codon:yes gene_type:complete